MFFLEILSRVVTILVGLSTLAERGVAYIKRPKEQKEKDPSASLAAPDGSAGDRMSDR